MYMYSSQSILPSMILYVPKTNQTELLYFPNFMIMFLATLLMYLTSDVLNDLPGPHVSTWYGIVLPWCYDTYWNISIAV